MKSIFITGTDTGVGKTLVTGLMARYFRDSGINAVTQKWIQTGCERFSKDIAAHHKIMGLTRNTVLCHPELFGFAQDKLSEGSCVSSRFFGLRSQNDNLFGVFQQPQFKNLLCPYIFKNPVSPHLAAEIEGKKILVSEIKNSFNALKKQFDCVIVEGIGGLLVPFNQNGLIIDIAKQLHMPVLLVADNRLGAINHILLTIEAIKKRGLKFLGVIFTAANKNEKELVLENNPQIIEAISKDRVLGTLPYEEDIEKLYELFRNSIARHCNDGVKIFA